jgi:hypothetical protein
MPPGSSATSLTYRGNATTYIPGADLFDDEMHKELFGKKQFA